MNDKIPEAGCPHCTSDNQLEIIVTSSKAILWLCNSCGRTFVVYKTADQVK